MGGWVDAAVAGLAGLLIAWPTVAAAAAAVGGLVGIPFVSASITPLFSRYLRNSSFLESGVCAAAGVASGMREAAVGGPAAAAADWGWGEVGA